MLSYRTCIELVSVLERMVTKDLNRLFIVFGLQHLIHPTLGKFSDSDKADILIAQLKYPDKKGPFTDSFQMDLLQYRIDQFYRYKEDELGLRTYNYGTPIAFDDLFANEHKSLCRFLKQDGYIIVGRNIQKLLPEEIEEAKTENELYQLLDSFKFDVAKGHLEQARKNIHSNNWASANSQFRSFIEALLIGICKKLLPLEPCNNAHQAIKLLGGVKLNPPFLKAELNEIEYTNFKYPFVESIWKRLHPEGSHPGLSDEDDATFRYHITVVFAHYLLNQLSNLT